MSDKTEGREVGYTNKKYPAIVRVNKAEAVEVGVEKLFKAINSTMEHMESEVSRKLDEAEQAAKSILNEADFPLNQVFRTSEQVVEELSKPWFAYNFLEEVEAVRVAVAEGDVVGTAFHSMLLTHYESTLALMSVEHEILIGIKAKEVTEDNKTYTDAVKKDWNHLIVDAASTDPRGIETPTPELVALIMEKFAYPSTSDKSVSNYVRAWKKEVKDQQ